MLMRAFLVLAALLVAACDGEPVDYYDSARYDISWLWVEGTGGDADSAHGTVNVADPANSPGARAGTVSWIDADGIVWLFGGHGSDDTSAGGNFNDLWTYDGVNWTWVAGPATTDGPATYGTKGVAAPGNIPGARRNALGWVDADDNLWVFGGEGLDASGTRGALNDLWKFDTTTKAWTWVAGGDTRDAAGVYGTQGTADALNVPGGRESAVGWRDNAGNLWLFGGLGRDVNGDCCYLNDVWKFDPALGQWTWMKGPTVANTSGIYGEIGALSATGEPPFTYTPGGRAGAAAWHRADDTVLLFGGVGFDAIGTRTVFNDLWQYDVNPASDTYNAWVWISGTKDAFSDGNYGSRGAVTVTAAPPSRMYPVAWTDADGFAWMFGGAVEVSDGVVTYPNDLWRFDGFYWTWMGGSQTATSTGSYVAVGQRGQPAGRTEATGWIDALDNLWVYGGDGRDDVWLVAP